MESNGKVCNEVLYMTPFEYSKLLEYISNHNSWGIGSHILQFKLHRRVIKYVEASFDTRTGTIWRVTFKQCLAGKQSEQRKDFLTKSPADIARIYRWLDAEVR